TPYSGINPPKSPPAPPTRRHVIYNADGIDNPFLSSLKSRQNGFSSVASSSGYIGSSVQFTKGTSTSTPSTVLKHHDLMKSLC
uniref:Uncharacterized protein n=1 Tax=Romanomermis culicivorax TaxID=13658 RepID=A0A915KN50_ROMCU